MTNEHVIKLKEQIIIAINSFEKCEIDYVILMDQIYGYLQSIDNLDNKIMSAAITLGADMETIFFMEATSEHHKNMIEKVEKFRNYIVRLKSWSKH